MAGMTRTERMVQCLKDMDMDYIKCLVEQIKFIEGYERRHRYDEFPSMKSSLILVEAHLRQRIKEYKKEWGRVLYVRELMR